MAVYHILYNPMAGNCSGYERAQAVKSLLPDGETDFNDITKISDIVQYIANTPLDEKIIITGGDGTLNRFINDCADAKIKHEIYYCPTGSGNDFATDIDMEKDSIISLNPYINNLPTVTVNGVTSRFLNGVGYGIDGYCCEEGDKIRKSDAQKQINYTAIAIKGLLHGYSPTNAVVTVDGVPHKYEKVWLAPTMNGRFYGGGMMVAPDRERLDDDGKLSVVVMHGSGKLKTLAVFPSIFKGEHIKHKEMVEELTGSDITVEFDRPTALQIDGETITDVMQYSAKACRVNKNTAKAAV